LVRVRVRDRVRVGVGVEARARARARARVIRVPLYQCASVANWNLRTSEVMMEATLGVNLATKDLGAKCIAPTSSTETRARSPATPSPSPRGLIVTSVTRPLSRR
tara:strand:- start:163 stop:477 length:315 start_codon:yes stop_codon:yes gene_type:complete